MKKFRVLFGSTLVLFIGVVIMSMFITDRLKAYKEKKEEVALVMGFEDRLLALDNSILEIFGGRDMEAEWGRLETEANRKYNAALFYGLMLVLFVLLYVVVNILVYQKKVYKYQVYGMLMIFSALSFLFLGLQAPFIEVMAYEKNLAISIFGYDMDFDGRTYFLYQNKSVFQLISLLYVGGNYLVAIAVAVFSIIFPIIKLTTSIVVLLKPQQESSKRLYKFIRNLGKWSMADVFVAGVFLAVFAFSNMDVGVDTGSSTLIGIYFYLIFVILSINSGQYLKKAMKKNQTIVEGELD